MAPAEGALFHWPQWYRHGNSWWKSDKLAKIQLYSEEKMRKELKHIQNKWFTGSPMFIKYIQTLVTSCCIVVHYRTISSINWITSPVALAFWSSSVTEPRKPLRGSWRIAKSLQPGASSNPWCNWCCCAIACFEVYMKWFTVYRRSHINSIQFRSVSRNILQELSDSSAKKQNT